MIKCDAVTIAELCLRSSEQYAGRRAFEMFGGGAVRGQVSYRLLGIRARQIASLLGRLGVGAAGRVLLLSENRPEWPLAYFGIALAGAVSVPVLTGFPACQVRHICEHAGVSAVCLSRSMAAKIEGVPAIPLIFIDSICGSDGEAADAAITVSLNGREQALPLQDPAAQGAALPFPQRNADELASIVYTSGTLGSSKGVMLSNRNLVSCARASRSLMPLSPRDRLLSVLPLAHTYECTLGLLTAVMSGARISYTDRPPSPSALLPAAKALRPTCMVTVPLLIEKIYRQHIAPALRASPLYRHALTRPLALLIAGRKLKAALGGSIRFLGIGGAPLSPETEDFLRKARFPYAPGYGLTETAPLVAGTAPFRFPLRSAGAILPGLAVRVTNAATSAAAAPGAIGEIEVRGPTVMTGYYRDEEQTRAAFTADGWLRTGDLGRMDRKGRLYIKGRLKALILGPSGENIYPEEIEGVLNASQLVEDALVYPGAKGELVALVRISESARAAAAATAQAAVSALERALEELRVWANQRLAAFSRVSRIELREEPFEKTPTLKIKRYLYGA